jgi:hypothetical protein
VGCSNYTGWQLMKALGISDRLNLQRFVAQQIHYTPQAREAEWELVPAGLDQGVGILVWSPIAGGLLSGKYRRGQPGPAGSRHVTDWGEPPVHDEDRLYDLVDVLVEVGEAHGVSAAQVTLAWLLARPGVTSLVIGRARTSSSRTTSPRPRSSSPRTSTTASRRSAAPPALPAVAPGRERLRAARSRGPGDPAPVPRLRAPGGAAQASTASKVPVRSAARSSRQRCTVRRSWR